MRTVCAALLTCACLCAAACSPGAASPEATSPAYTYARHYTSGQVASFAYTEHQAGAAGQLTAAAKLTSYVRDGVGGEQVRWTSLKEAGRNLSAQAQALPPYDLSLDPRAVHPVSAPKPGVSGELQGPVDDLLTFFVDLSPKVGIADLHRPGQSHAGAKLISGNFSSAAAPVGQDITRLTTTLTGLNSRQATFRSVYQPPARSDLKPYRAFMSSPVCRGVPDNFQLVQAQGSRYAALWGCESFTVTTVVDRGSGQIVSARMTDTLTVSGKLCQDKALTTCTSLPPTQQERLVTLSRS